MEHRGLADDMWDIHEVFSEYFPNLQRRNAFISIFFPF